MELHEESNGSLRLLQLVRWSDEALLAPWCPLWVRSGPQTERAGASAKCHQRNIQPV